MQDRLVISICLAAVYCLNQGRASESLLLHAEYNSSCDAGRNHQWPPAVFQAIPESLLTQALSVELGTSFYPVDHLIRQLGSKMSRSHKSHRLLKNDDDSRPAGSPGTEANAQEQAGNERTGPPSDDPPDPQPSATLPERVEAGSALLKTLMDIEAKLKKYNLSTTIRIMPC